MGGEERITSPIGRSVVEDVAEGGCAGASRRTRGRRRGERSSPTGEEQMSPTASRGARASQPHGASGAQREHTATAALLSGPRIASMRVLPEAIAHHRLHRRLAGARCHVRTEQKRPPPTRWPLPSPVPPAAGQAREHVAAVRAGGRGRVVLLRLDPERAHLRGDRTPRRRARGRRGSRCGRGRRRCPRYRSSSSSGARGRETETLTAARERGDASTRSRRRTLGLARRPSLCRGRPGAAHGPSSPSQPVPGGPSAAATNSRNSGAGARGGT